MFVLSCHPLGVGTQKFRCLLSNTHNLFRTRSFAANTFTNGFLIYTYTVCPEIIRSFKPELCEFFNFASTNWTRAHSASANVKFVLEKKFHNFFFPFHFATSKLTGCCIAFVATMSVIFKILLLLQRKEWTFSKKTMRENSLTIANVGRRRKHDPSD